MDYRSRDLVTLGISAKVFLEQLEDMLRVWHTRRAMTSQRVLLERIREPTALGDVSVDIRLAACMEHMHCILQENVQMAQLLDEYADENDQLRESQSVGSLEGNLPSQIVQQLYTPGRQHDLEYFKNKLTLLKNKAAVEAADGRARIETIDKVL